jgi:uncharacterized protein YvpB
MPSAVSKNTPKSQKVLWVLLAVVGIIIFGYLAILFAISMNTNQWNSPQALTLTSLARNGISFSTPSPTYFQPYKGTPTPTLTSVPSTTPTGIPTLTPTNTSTPTVSFTPTITETPISTETPTATTESNLPIEAQIKDISGHDQLYTLDCESRSAVDWANYFGTSIDENEFLSFLPRSDNPEKGFVGNYWDGQGQIPPNSYGVHAEPIAALLRAYGVLADAENDFSWEDLQREIAASRPVIAWVIYGLGYSDPVSYVSSDGETSTVAAYEHTVIVVGYSSTKVTVLDGGLRYSRPISQFLLSWSVLGNMVIIAH